MSKMTSSTNKPSLRNKTLTDFSIDTIIGKGCKPQQSSTTQHRQTYSSELSKNDQQALIKTETPTRYDDGHEQGRAGSSQPVAITEFVQRKYRPKNFQCPACKMAFSNNGQLKNHVRIHTGERPFTCNHPQCNKTFTRNEELTRHKLIHTGVRPHSCTSCGKRFGRKDHLKKHIRTHERKKNRKKVFVPAKTNFIEDDVFVPPKPANHLRNHEQIEALRLSPMATKPTTELRQAINSFPSATTAPISFLLNQTTTSTPMSNAPTTTTTTTTTAAAVAIQQFASDYWTKWYNLIGFYHHQHCPQTDRLTDALFRRS